MSSDFKVTKRLSSPRLRPAYCCFFVDIYLRDDLVVYMFTVILLST